MKGKIFAAAIIAIFLVSMIPAVIPAVNAETPVSDYKAAYPDKWIDYDVQEITANAVPVGEARFGFACTMIASDDEEGSGEDKQTGIRGDLRFVDPGFNNVYDGSYVYYNGEQYRLHGVLDYARDVINACYADQSYEGWIWRENPDPAMSNGYEEYRFKANDVNIDQTTRKTYYNYDHLVSSQDKFAQFDMNYQLYAELEFYINPAEGNIEDGWTDTGTWDTYLFYAAGEVYSETTYHIPGEVYVDPSVYDAAITSGDIILIPDFHIDIHYTDFNVVFSGLSGGIVQPGVFYSSTENAFFVSDIYNFTWLQPMTKEHFKAGRTLPVKFSAADPRTGDFIHDETVNVEIFDSTGTQVFNAVHGEGSQNVRIDDTDNLYIVNWHTEKTYSGDYIIIVSFSNGFVIPGVVTL